MDDLTLHEFKTAWEILEIPYVPGDYTSIFPEKLIENHPELLELQGEFPDLLSTKVPSNNEEDELKVPEEPKDRFDLT